MASTQAEWERIAERSGIPSKKNLLLKKATKIQKRIEKKPTAASSSSEEQKNLKIPEKPRSLKVGHQRVLMQLVLGVAQLSSYAKAKCECHKCSFGRAMEDAVQEEGEEEEDTPALEVPAAMEIADLKRKGTGVPEKKPSNKGPGKPRKKRTPQDRVESLLKKRSPLPKKNGTEVPKKKKSLLKKKKTDEEEEEAHHKKVVLKSWPQRDFLHLSNQGFINFFLLFLLPCFFLGKKGWF
jgi:hypothetical protein